MIAWFINTRFGRLLAAGAAAAAAATTLLVAVWQAGRESARADALRRQLRAEQARRSIEDDIQTDPDLAARARRAGLVRPGR